MRMNQAITRALADEMRTDPDVIVLGEDVGAAGGPFKTSEGLADEFGSHRVRDTPISEMGFLGAALGAAATGLRPVVEIMFMEFLGVALDQLATEAAKFHYLSGGKLRAPLTVRASVGAGTGFGCQHSQTLETWLLATPGLKVVEASGPAGAYRLMRAAIRDDDPVVVLEPRRLYGRRGEVDIDGPPAVIGAAERVAAGDDVTVVALGATVETATEAVSRSGGWSADVIDLATLVPFDRSTVAESVRRTHRLVIVEEAPKTGGWGSLVAAEIAGSCHGDLTAPITRITGPDVPIPYPAHLEERWVPQPDYVAAQIDELVRTGKRPIDWWEVA